MLQVSVSVSNFDFGALYLGVELLNCTLIQSLAFEGTVELVSTEAAAFYFSMRFPRDRISCQDYKINEIIFLG